MRVLVDVVYTARRLIVVPATSSSEGLHVHVPAEKPPGGARRKLAIEQSPNRTGFRADELVMAAQGRLGEFCDFFCDGDITLILHVSSELS